MGIILNLSQGRAFRHNANGMERGAITVMVDSNTDQVFDWKEAAFVLVEWESGGEEGIYAVSPMTRH